MRLFLLFVVVPAIELMLLIEIGRVIGTVPTFGIIVATGLVGSTLARHQGLSVWRRFNQRLTTGQLPGDELIDGLIILVSAALLLTPGVVTDVVGLLGLVPMTRRALRTPIKARLMSRVSFDPHDHGDDHGVRLGGQASDRPSYTRTHEQA